MNILTKDYFNEGQLKNTNDVLKALELLEHDLPLLELQHLRSFNYTYLTITRNVRQAVKKGVFKHRKFLHKFDGRFAYYYTGALHQYLEKGRVAPAWRIAFEQAKAGECTPFVAMALGVNAHVNNDIPQVLKDCEAKKTYHADYYKVNKIIGSSIDEVVDAFDEDSSITGPKRPLLRPAYKLTMSNLIKVWRRNAWRKFEDLRDGNISVSNIEQDAYKTAKQILYT